MAKKDYIRWAIMGECGLYVGQHLTRKDAIADHVDAKYGVGRWVGTRLSTAQLEAWHKCRARGDRAVKVKISLIREKSS